MLIKYDSLNYFEHQMVRGLILVRGKILVRGLCPADKSKQNISGTKLAIVNVEGYLS
jgi:hypothetical protein